MNFVLWLCVVVAVAIVVRWKINRDMQQVFERMQEALRQARLEREDHEEFLSESMQWLQQWGVDARETVDEFRQVKIILLNKVGDA